MLVFVTGKPFQLSLMFVGKAIHGNIRLGWRGLPGTNTSLLRKSENYGHKKFYSTDP